MVFWRIWSGLVRSYRFIGYLRYYRLAWSHGGSRSVSIWPNRRPLGLPVSIGCSFYRSWCWCNPGMGLFHLRSMDGFVWLVSVWSKRAELRTQRTQARLRISLTSRNPYRFCYDQKVQIMSPSTPVLPLHVIAHPFSVTHVPTDHWCLPIFQSKGLVLTNIFTHRERRIADCDAWTADRTKVTSAASNCLTNRSREPMCTRSTLHINFRVNGRRVALWMIRQFVWYMNPVRSVLFKFVYFFRLVCLGMHRFETCRLRNFYPNVGLYSVLSRIGMSP